MAALWIAGAVDARADKVTLTNGDVLHGEVREEGGRVRIRHAILGDLDLAKSDVMWITKEGEPPPPAAATSAPASSPCGAPCGAETPAPEERCPSPWDLAVALGLSNDAGNTEKLKLNADLETGYRWSRNEVRWRFSAYYEEASGVQTEGKLDSNLWYRRRISPRGALFGTWFLNRDDFADIELRNGWFAGYERDLVRGRRTRLYADVGAGAVVEKRSGIAAIETAALLARAAFEHEFEHGDTFKAQWRWVPYLDYVERSPMRLELRYAHPLREHLDVVAGFLLDYVPDPPGDVDPVDTKITFGVRWKK